jgi:oligopeptide/dipeptide ABC transporter ATP-binding protein
VSGGILKAVNGVSLTIREGETIGLVGESGCGKSTLGKTILRLIRPAGGQVLFDGRDIWSFSRAERKAYTRQVQMIFQDPYACLDPLSVIGDTVAEGMDIHRLNADKAERGKAILRLLNDVGLNESHVNRFPHEFSGGQRQRVGIARALSLTPRLIVCDEPNSALDVSIQAQILNLLMDLQEEMGLTYLFITHDLSVVRHISRRIMVMYLGKCVEIADSHRIFENPLHPYTKALLAAIPIPSIESLHKHRDLLQGEVTSPVDPKPGCRFAARCPHATPACLQSDIPMTEYEPGHFVACKLYS